VAHKLLDHEHWKSIEWMGSSRKVLRSFPKAAKVIMGQALVYAQAGSKHEAAKQMKGNLRDVFEIRADTAGQAFRTTYVTKFGEVVYVLHVFNKKSARGSETPRHDLDTIEIRLRAARQHYEKNYKG
jgi:phage-related protein